MLIDRAIRAKGGAEKLRSIKTVKAAATFRLSVAGGEAVDVETVTSIQYPGSFRSESKTPAGPLVQVFHNGTGWVRDQRGAREVPVGVAEEMRAKLQRDTIGLLVGLLDKRLTAIRIADVDVAGQPMPAVEVKGPAMAPLTIVFDRATALIVRQRSTSRGSAGATPVETEEEFSDFRDVGGLKVPFNAVVRVAGEVTVRRTLHQVEYNVPLGPALFSLQS